MRSKNIVIIFFTLLTFVGCDRCSKLAGKAEKSVPEGCPGDLTLHSYNYGQKIKARAGGEIQICGNKDEANRFWGEIFFRPEGAKEFTRVVQIGGPTELDGILKTEFWQMTMISRGLELIKLIPFRDSYIKALAFTMDCTKRKCEKFPRPICRFQQPRLTLNKNVISNIQEFISGSGSAPKSQHLFALYGNALMGHLPSLILLKSKRLEEKLDNRDRDHFLKLREIVFTLESNKCLTTHPDQNHPAQN